jgi:CDP-diglyceride synthetase
LITDINVLSEPAHGGVLDQLDSLYVTPDASA